jgi:subtilisin family serine protease
MLASRGRGARVSVLQRTVTAGVIATLVLAMAPGPGAASAATPDPSTRAVVTLDRAGPDAVWALAGTGARVLEEIPALDAVVVEIPADRRAAVTRALHALPGADRVEADPIASIARVPGDPLWSHQWGLRTVGAPAAWDHTLGSSSTIIAILDTGVDASHPDLSGGVLAGRDFVNGDLDASDDNGHGTMAAGIAAARTDNATGIAGTCWRCRILPVKVLDAEGTGSHSQIANGIVWAADQGAHVISMSLGSPSASTVLANAVAYAESKGAVVVAAAGNAGSTTKAYPAAYPSVIGVAASTSSDGRYAWSNHGSWVSVAAPGCNPATAPGGRYVEMCGTSASAPMVAGVVALARSHAPTSTVAALRESLLATAAPVGSWVAAGRVDAAAQIAALPWGTTEVAEPTPTSEPEPVSEPASEPAPAPAPAPGPSGACTSEAAGMTFTDVDPGSVHAGAISCLAWWSLTAGNGDGTYGPERSLSRAQGASLLARTIAAAAEALPAGPPRFDDIAGSVHAASIEALAAAGILDGTGPTTFDPSDTVTRAQMATFLVRTHEHLAGRALPSAPTRFADTAGSVHEPNIDRAAAAGLISGVIQDRFEPSRPVRRDQVATLLTRMLERLVADGDLAAPTP